MDLRTLRDRIETGEEYLLALEDYRNREWEEVYVDYCEGRLGLPQAMVLVHPDFYRERAAEAGQCIRGTRRFSNVAGRHVAGCMAERVWLAPCPLERPEELHADHLFPFSLGGPTCPENQLFLCPVHNSCKAGDVHLFPWEQAAPDWLGEQIRKIRTLLLS